MTSKKPPAGRNDYRLQLFIELYSGMRMGEINALTPDCIDFENNVIHVSATISKGVDSKSFVKEGTKTETGVRDVPISNTLRPYLEEALRRYKSNKQKLVFYDHTSKSVITTSQVNSYYRRVCDSVGIETSGQHSLRHTFATRMREAGADMKATSEMMGHEGIMITLTTYTDASREFKNREIAVLKDYYESIV
jgi:integrase